MNTQISKTKVSQVTTVAYIVTALMLSTAVVYFIAASQDYVQIFQSVSSQHGSSKDMLADLIGTTNEMIFYIAVGIAISRSLCGWQELRIILKYHMS